MAFLQTYYPFFLYAIPYVIAAFVLIRAKRQRMQEAREAAIRQHRIEAIVEPRREISRFGSSSVTKIIHRLTSRKAA